MADSDLSVNVVPFLGPGILLEPFSELFLADTRLRLSPFFFSAASSSFFNSFSSYTKKIDSTVFQVHIPYNLAFFSKHFFRKKLYFILAINNFSNFIINYLQKLQQTIWNELLAIFNFSDLNALANKPKIKLNLSLYSITCTIIHTNDSFIQCTVYFWKFTVHQKIMV
jgi:hypothetical protein